VRLLKLATFMAFKSTATLRFDFKTPEHAVIAARSLSVGDDLKPTESTSTFSADANFLVFDVQATNARHLKKAITTTLPSIELIEQIITELAIT
jgi:tRNA threonylcarbamoyladenosine modification (KEOPS) complex  Pcc1 subunit